MSFVDECSISVIAGKGGNGCLSFLRERCRPKGGPDGGNGGDGGSIFLKTDSSINTLIDIRPNKTYRAKNGSPGEGKRRSGASANDLYIPVPVGTLVFEQDTNILLGDLKNNLQTLQVAAGGKGGLGNAHFKSSANRAPRKVQQGTEGESIKLRLELRLLADVGLVGLPNAGKSSLLRQLSNAKPEVGDYPFTTLSPQLGMIELEETDRCVMADIPGLIKGASQGKGRGNQFLRQISRTALLLHIVDIADKESETILEDIKTIENELAATKITLAQPKWLVLNKIDKISDATLNQVLRVIYATYNNVPVHCLSAKSGKGCDVLVTSIMEWLKKPTTN